MHSLLRLGQLMLEGTSAQSFRAQLALVFAAADSYGGGGTPYAGTVDVFIPRLRVVTEPC